VILLASNKGDTHYIIFKNNFMAGRGDNNKHGSAGRGSSNQSNQGFIADGEKEPKSNHNKNQTGGKASKPSPKTGDQDSNRNEHLKESKKD
jgi:hypothetical protein